MSKKRKPLEVIWEYEPSPDAEERLARAFEIIFNKMGEEPQSPQEEPKPKKQGVLFKLKDWFQK